MKKKYDVKLILFGLGLIIASIALFGLSITGCKNAFYFASPGTVHVGYCLLNLVLVFFTWSTAAITLLFGAASLTSGLDIDLS